MLTIHTGDEILFVMDNVPENLITYPEAKQSERRIVLLADSHCILAESGTNTTIVTQSVIYQMAVRVNVQRGLIKPENVRFIHHWKEQETVLIPTANGRLDQWPEGFFDMLDNLLDQLI